MTEFNKNWKLTGKDASRCTKNHNMAKFYHLKLGDKKAVVSGNLDYSGTVVIRGENGCPTYYCNTTKHRCKIIAKLLNNNEWYNIPNTIRENYTTGGFNTRIGIYRAMKSEKTKNRIEEIARSHARYNDQYGYDNGGRIGHEIRVSMR